jgi:hypothetical protein
VRGDSGSDEVSVIWIAGSGKVLNVEPTKVAAA